MSKQYKARQLALLGIILQSLHFLFGITAVLGMLIAHTRINTTDNTIYRSHLIWQLVTFWAGLAAYSLAFWFWLARGQAWPIPAVAAFVIYRLLVNIQYWIAQRPIQRLI